VMERMVFLPMCDTLSGLFLLLNHSCVPKQTFEIGVLD
jgi:hypothetical protein